MTAITTLSRDARDLLYQMCAPHPTAPGQTGRFMPQPPGSYGASLQRMLLAAGLIAWAPDGGALLATAAAVGRQGEWRRR